MSGAPPFWVYLGCGETLNYKVYLIMNYWATYILYKRWTTYKTIFKLYYDVSQPIVRNNMRNYAERSKADIIFSYTWPKAIYNF